MNQPRYAAKVIESVQTRPGCWNTLRVGVYEGEKLLGEYGRNYSAPYDTFHPFERDGKWYALYSRDYTATRVMSLPDCVDLGGEEPHAHGFCPTEYLVPVLDGQLITAEDPRPRLAHHDHERWATKTPSECGQYTRYWWPDDPKHPSPDEARKAAFFEEKARTLAEYDAWQARHPHVKRHAKWGLVAGCVWGEDSGNWKVGFLDLSRAAEGIIVRDNRFGYLELGPGATLATGVDTLCIENLNAPPDEMRITIAVSKRFFVSGRR